MGSVVGGAGEQGTAGVGGLMSSLKNHSLRRLASVTKVLGWLSLSSRPVCSGLLVRETYDRGPIVRNTCSANCALAAEASPRAHRGSMSLDSHSSNLSEVPGWDDIPPRICRAVLAGNAGEAKQEGADESDRTGDLRRWRRADLRRKLRLLAHRLRRDRGRQDESDAMGLEGT